MILLKITILVFQAVSKTITFTETVFLFHFLFLSSCFFFFCHGFVLWYQSKNLWKPLIKTKELFLFVCLVYHLDNLSRRLPTCQMGKFSHSPHLGHSSLDQTIECQYHSGPQWMRTCFFFIFLFADISNYPWFTIVYHGHQHRSLI